MPRRPSKTKRTKNPESTPQVRIIAGDWRGRVLQAPSVDGLRPTGNRIRETLFNWLMPILPGANCLDAFSGTGALGFEALSRGASRAVMLEFDQEAHQNLNDNADLLGADRAKIFATRAEQWLNIPATETFDIVFIDPPFAADLWATVIDRLESNGWLNPGAHIYIENPRGQALTTPSHWQLHRQKSAGNVTFSLYLREHADLG